jgi:hypothetical protein
METIEKTHLNIKSSADLKNEIVKTISKIEAYVKFNEYELIKNKEFDLSKEFDKLRLYLNDSSLRKRKTLRRQMFRLNKHITIAGANKFLHFLFSKIMKSENRYKILKSQKEQEIIAKRKAYIAALQIMKVAEKDYFDTKGDFYRNRLKNNQSI